jgi:hypothetical protein
MGFIMLCFYVPKIVVFWTIYKLFFLLLSLSWSALVLSEYHTPTYVLFNQKHRDQTTRSTLKNTKSILKATAMRRIICHIERYTKALVFLDKLLRACHVLVSYFSRIISLITPVDRPLSTLIPHKDRICLQVMAREDT